METLVDGDAVERAQHVARSAHSVEGRFAHRRQTERLFAEIGIHLVVVVLVLALDRLLEVVGGNAQPLRQLLDGVGLHDVALLEQPVVEPLHRFERHVRGRPVLEGIHTCAAVDVELLQIRLVIRIPDVHHCVVRLRERRVQDVVVRTGLVGEALAVEVHLEPRIRTHPEQRARGLRAAELVGLHGNAVEHHGRMHLVHVRARPQARLDAVARGAVDGDGQRVFVERLGLQRLQHVLVARVAARAHHDALAGVDLDVALGALRDGPGHLAVFVQQLHERRGEAEVHAHAFSVVTQDDLAVHHVLEAGELGIGRPAGNVAGCPVLADRRFGIVRSLEEQLEASLLQTILIPVDGLAGVLRPQVVQARVAVSVRVTHEIVAYLVLVDLAARLPLQAAVDRAEVVAHAATDGALLKADDLRALLGSRACGEQARGARSAHEHLGVHRFDDLVLGNLGLLTQPVVRRRSGLVLLRRRSLRRAPRQPCARKRSGCGTQSQKCAAAQPLALFRHNAPLPFERALPDSSDSSKTLESLWFPAPKRPSASTASPSTLRAARSKIVMPPE